MSFPPRTPPSDFHVSDTRSKNELTFGDQLPGLRPDCKVWCHVPPWSDKVQPIRSDSELWTPEMS